MKIEDLMPHLRAGEKVKCVTWAKGDYMYFVVKKPDPCAIDANNTYTGFIAVVSGNEYIFELNGEDMMLGEWELYNG